MSVGTLTNPHHCFQKITTPSLFYITKTKPYSTDGSALQQSHPDPPLVTVSTFSVTVDSSSWFTAALVTLMSPGICISSAFCMDAQVNTQAFQLMDTLSNSGHFFYPLLGHQFL